MEKDYSSMLVEFKREAGYLKAFPKKKVIPRNNQTCMYVSKQSCGHRFLMTFSNEIWRALEAPKYVECYWYKDSLVLVSSTSGFWVGMNNTVKHRGVETFKGRFRISVKVLFESIVSQWQLKGDVGCVYSGGSFVKTSFQGRPAVVISRTSDDFFPR